MKSSSRLWQLEKAHVQEQRPSTAKNKEWLCSCVFYLPDAVGIGCVCISCSVVSKSTTPWTLQPARLLCPWNSPGKNTGVGCHFLLQGIFPTQGLNTGLPHCRPILYYLCHQGRCKHWGWQSWLYFLFSRPLFTCICVHSQIFVIQEMPAFHLYPQSFCGVFFTLGRILFNLKVTQIHTKQVTGK